MELLLSKWSLCLFSFLRLRSSAISSLHSHALAIKTPWISPWHFREVFSYPSHSSMSFLKLSSISISFSLCNLYSTKALAYIGENFHSQWSLPWSHLSSSCGSIKLLLAILTITSMRSHLWLVQRKTKMDKKVWKWDRILMINFMELVQEASDIMTNRSI